MSFEITDEIIIEEYLNNWFTYEELGQYLCIEPSEVKRVLENKDLITHKYTDTKYDKIQNHTEHINKYYNDNKDKEILNEEEKKVICIANYIIINNASLRDTATHFSCGKSTVYDYINEKLPDISINKYKQVFDVLMSNKSFSINNKKIIEQVLTIYELLMSGVSCEEICKILSLSRSVVQRDLTTRLRKIDKEKALFAEYKLIQNQYTPLEENSFRVKR